MKQQTIDVRLEHERDQRPSQVLLGPGHVRSEARPTAQA
jgi:hypothetical protein